MDLGSGREEFSGWFVEVPIPFRPKVRLYEAVTKDSDLIRRLGGVTTSREVDVPAERVSIEVLQDRLERLAHLDNLILHLLGWEIEGPPEPVFTDDYADWPFGVFLP